MSMLSLRPVKPRDCLLAVALPTSRCQFLKSGLSPNRDFVSFLRRGYAGHLGVAEVTLSQVLDVYQPTLNELRLLVDSAREAGFRVVEGCRAGDLAAAFAEPVYCIVLFAHWVPHDLGPHQVLDEDRFRTALVRLLAGARSSIEQEALLPLVEKAPLFELCRELNKALTKPGLFAPAGTEVLAWSERFAAFENRNVLDSMGSDILLPGNRIELVDGLHSADSFRELIPASFDGVLDLTVCNSVVLIERIKLARRCTCIGNQETVNIQLRAIFYKGLFQVIERHEADYVETYQALRVELGHGL